MQRVEYKVVPAPRKGEKARGLKTTEDRFAYALARVMNEMAREGWDYQRTDTLPVEERSGLTGTKTVFQNMLVFRRAVPQPTPAAVPAIDPQELAAKRSALIAQPSLGGAAKPEAAHTAPSLGPANPDTAKSEVGKAAD